MPAHLEARAIETMVPTKEEGGQVHPSVFELDWGGQNLGVLAVIRDSRLLPTLAAHGPGAQP
jgi:hypothetical protein